LLLWDDGLIQTEICRKKNKNCHIGSIKQVILNESDIYTVGQDGCIRVWDFETIDTSEPSEEGMKLEMEPLNELIVGKDVSLSSIVKDFTEESTIWYGQDSNGAIWSIDLSFSAMSAEPQQLFNYHAGVINGISCCPTSHLFVTTADDGSVKVYNYLTYEVVVQKKFKKSGTCVRWLPTQVDSDGATIAAGFEDGVLRFLKLVPKSSKANQFDIILFEVFKPNTKEITQLAFDSSHKILAVGSNDSTVFFFSNSNNKRKPIGFVNLPAPITFMTWTPADYKQNRLLVCCSDGSVYEYEAPLTGESVYDTTKTYLIDSKLKCRKYKFKSIKSRLRHEEELERQRIEEEERLKREQEEKKLRGLDEEEENEKKKEKKSGGEGEDEKTGEENQENKEGEEKEEEEEEEEEDITAKEPEWQPFIPKNPSRICWATYSCPDTFWLSMNDFDAGYLYQCKYMTDDEKSKLPSPDKIDEPIQSVAVVASDILNLEDIVTKQGEKGEGGEEMDANKKMLNEPPKQQQKQTTSKSNKPTTPVDEEDNNKDVPLTCMIYK
jgi:cilia- and flagella-associated protein 44